MRKLTFIIAALLFASTANSFPTIGASSTGSPSGQTNSLDQPITLPTTVNAGELILCAQTVDGTNALTWDNTTEGTWTELLTNPNFATGRTEVWAKIADGSEGGATIDNDVTVNAQQSTFICVTIQNWYGDLSGVEVPAAAKDTSGTTADPDPPSITPSWGGEDNLIIVVSGSDSNRTVTAFPFADNQIQIQDGADGTTTAMCTDELTATTVDPGAFTISAADEWIAVTIAIRPAESAGRKWPAIQEGNFFPSIDPIDF